MISHEFCHAATSQFVNFISGDFSSCSNTTMTPSLRIFLCIGVVLVLLPRTTIGYGAAYGVYEEHHCQRCAEGCFDSLAQCRHSHELAVERAVEERCAPRETWWQEIISTVEVLIRGFRVFGSRMMMFLFSSRVDSPSQQLSQMRDLVQVAIMTGLSTACTLIGVSLFLPTNQRIAWFRF